MLIINFHTACKFEGQNLQETLKKTDVYKEEKKLTYLTAPRPTNKKLLTNLFFQDP